MTWGVHYSLEFVLLVAGMVLSKSPFVTRETLSAVSAGWPIENCMVGLNTDKQSSELFISSLYFHIYVHSLKRENIACSQCFLLSHARRLQPDRCLFYNSTEPPTWASFGGDRPHSVGAVILQSALDVRLKRQKTLDHRTSQYEAHSNARFCPSLHQLHCSNRPRGHDSNSGHDAVEGALLHSQCGR
jgi:hypothetical protein